MVGDPAGLWKEENTKSEVLKMFDGLSQRDAWIFTFVCVLMAVVGFYSGSLSQPFIGNVSASNDPYVQNQGHYPGIFVERPPYNTTCNEFGNTIAQQLKQRAVPGTVRMKWLGGWDTSFISGLKIHSDDGREDIVYPRGNPGDCAYIFNVSASVNVTAYGQNVVTGEWIQLGKG